MILKLATVVLADVLEESGQAVRVLVISGFEKFGGASLSNQRRSGEHFWRLSRLREQSRHFGFNTIDDKNSAQ
jgi:hypothetical protein